MSKEKILNVETLVSAIKEVAAVISENGGANIEVYARQITADSVAAKIIIEPYRFISKADKTAVKDKGRACEYDPDNYNPIDRF